MSATGLLSAMRGTAAAARARPADASRPGVPSLAHRLANFAASQAAWFAAVLGAAHGHPVAGALPALAVVGWHLAISARPGAEARLVLAATALGAVFETTMLATGLVAYAPHPGPAGLPPGWLLALWAVFAATLNVTLRGLRGRPALAALLGAVAGPAAFSSGVRLGAAHFVDPTAALAALAVGWAIAMPVLMALASRWDGVLPREPAHG